MFIEVNLNLNWVNANLKWVTVAAGMVALALILLGFLFYQYQQGKRVAQSAPGSPEEVRSLVAEVSKVFELPQGEEPTVATIKDIEKLQNEPFFQKAKNGDKVLLYNNAGKIILYDPSRKRVLNVAPYNPGTPSAQETTPGNQ